MIRYLINFYTVHPDKLKAGVWIFSGVVCSSAILGALIYAQGANEMARFAGVDDQTVAEFYIRPNKKTASRPLHSL